MMNEGKNLREKHTSKDYMAPVKAKGKKCFRGCIEGTREPVKAYLGELLDMAYDRIMDQIFRS